MGGFEEFVLSSRFATLCSLAFHLTRCRNKFNTGEWNENYVKGKGVRR